MHPHLSRNMSQDFMTIIQFNPEHRIGKRLNNGTLNLNSFFFGHKPLISCNALLPAQIKP